MKNLLLSCFCLLAVSSSLSAKDIQIQQKSSGKKLSVEVLSAENGKVKVKTSKGKTFVIPLDKLTKESVNLINEQLKDVDGEETKSESNQKGKAANEKDSVLFKRVNTAVGSSLFGSKESLWTEDAGEIAKRLDWKLESRKDGISSYRKYTKLDYQFLGAHPYCVTLYGGKGDLPEQFSLIYANKGDFGSKVGMGEDHFKKIHPGEKAPGNLEDAIKMDQKLIAQKITGVLGDSKEQYYGEKEDKRKVQRWDVKSHAFLLSAKKGEYVHLIIVPVENADAQGKVKFIKDSELKKQQLTNVVKEDNGDVWIDNIPMVNQGPKGYCAPATFERAMRYMRVPADMYLLATAATTQKGTNTSKLADDCKRIVRSKARRIKDLDLKKGFKIKNLKKFIDKGVPVLWQMRSLKKYNDIANARSKERSSVKDMSSWANTIQAEADKVKKQLKTEDKHHICMIIGYNEATKEVAVSDSWGPKYEIRWVHVDVAEAVTNRGGFVIDF